MPNVFTLMMNCKISAVTLISKLLSLSLSDRTEIIVYLFIPAARSPTRAILLYVKKCKLYPLTAPG